MTSEDEESSEGRCFSIKVVIQLIERAKKSRLGRFAMRFGSNSVFFTIAESRICITVQCTKISYRCIARVS